MLQYDPPPTKLPILTAVLVVAVLIVTELFVTVPLVLQLLLMTNGMIGSTGAPVGPCTVLITFMPIGWPETHFHLFVTVTV